jgi:hypothetical protein
MPSSTTFPLLFLLFAIIMIHQSLFAMDTTTTTTNDNDDDDDQRTILQAKLRFPRYNHTREDTWQEFRHLDKLRRWDKEPNSTEHDPVNMEEMLVTIKDATQQEMKTGKEFTVSVEGFERVDLHPRILPMLREIKNNGLSGNRVGPTTAGGSIFSIGFDTDETVEDRLARSLQGYDSFSLGGNTYHYALRCAGFVIRKGGPEGAKLEGKGFDMVAQRVHIDQDLDGEPLLSMGMTWIFKLPGMRLLNIWSPLHDVRMRPLAFADQRSVTRLTDVLRYRTNSTVNAGGRFGSFRSDRLMSMYNDKQQWWWFPNTRFGHAIAFDTGSVPHSSFSLPGEGTLGELRNQLVDVAKNGKQSQFCHKIDATKVTSKQVSVDMDAFIGATREFLRRGCEGRATSRDFDEMLEFVTRASLEIRCVTFVIPKPIGNTIFGCIVGLAIIFMIYRLVFKRNRSNELKEKKMN